VELSAKLKEKTCSREEAPQVLCDSRLESRTVDVFSQHSHRWLRRSSQLLPVLARLLRGSAVSVACVKILRFSNQLATNIQHPGTQIVFASINGLL
jgi:hypothetical protein